MGMERMYSMCARELYVYPVYSQMDPRTLFFFSFVVTVSSKLHVLKTTTIFILFYSDRYKV